MNVRHQLLLAISLLFFSNATLAVEDSGYLAVTNAGFVDVTATIEVQSHADNEHAEIYRDQLIIEEADSMVDEPGVSSIAEDGE